MKKHNYFHSEVLVIGIFIILLLFIELAIVVKVAGFTTYLLGIIYYLTHFLKK